MLGIVSKGRLRQQATQENKNRQTNTSLEIPVVLHVLPSEFRVDPVLHEHIKLPCVLVQM